MAKSRFRRPGGEDVAEAAQRRLDLLRQELAQAGVHPTAAAPDPVPGPAEVPEPGRHARRRGPGPGARLGSRLSGWVVDRLPATLQGRVRVGSAQTALVVVLAALGLAVAAVLALRSGSGGEAMVPVSSARAPAGTGRGPLVTPVPSASTIPSPETPTATPGVVVVDVAGKVRHPGVATLPLGSRVVDAIRKAGGVRRGVDLAGLNLARVLVDGEQVLVGVAPPPGVAASAASASTAAAAPGQLVNLNTATLAGLEALPGVGPVTAQKILDWRTAHGSFSSVDELLEVDGIGEKTLADLAPYVTL